MWSSGARVWVIAGLLAVVSVAVLLGQVEVSDDAAEATRSCGSVLDSVIDRSGWDLWWASDLDEPDPAVRTQLVRTRLCPEAVNRRLSIASAIGAVAVGASLLARTGGDPERRRGEPGSGAIGARLARIGTVSSRIGLGLSLAGLAAIVVLVGDAQSTLFLYTDRLVVAVVGLLVLTPTIALFVIGRVLTVLGAHLDDDAAEASGETDG